MTIKELRTKTNMSQSKFADYTGIPVGTIQNWEQDKRKTPDYVLSLIEYKLRNEHIIE